MKIRFILGKKSSLKMKLEKNVKYIHGNFNKYQNILLNKEFYWKGHISLI